MSLFGGHFPDLRDFQVSAHEALRQAVAEGHRCILIMAPTGAGKTVLAFNVVKETIEKVDATGNLLGNRAGFLCDRKTLIAQTSNAAREVGLGDHGIIQADNPMLDLRRPFQIMSVQTLARRGWPNDLNVVVVDECHTRHDAWVEHLTAVPDACPRCGKSVVTDPGRPNFPRCEDKIGCRWRMPVVVGLSATPFTKGLGKLFTKLVNAATMDDLTRKGILVPMRVFSCRKPDMTGAETKSDGEWTDKAAEERELAIIGDVVLEWTRFAEGRKTICFGSTINHARELAKQFNEAGVPAGVICADTPDDERARLFEDFKWGRLTVLCSVEALAKGFDQKDIGAVIDARPLRKSMSTALQMWGRGLRSCEETNKTDCFLLDFSGNVIRFQQDFERVYFDGLDRLDDGEKLDREIRKDEEHEVRRCPKCGHEPFARKCTACGYESKPQSLVEHLSGKMAELPILCGKRKLANNHLDLWVQLATYARQHQKPGKDPHKRALAMFRDITGVWPPHGLKADEAPWVEPNRATIDKIRSLQIAFAHRRSA
jgi:superfamily II DNA or RNA helicase